VEAVEEFDPETTVVIGERADAEAPLLPRPANHVPGDKALSPRDFFGRRPEECAASAVEGSQHTGREIKRRHGIGRQCIEDSVEKHEAPPKGEELHAPPREILIHLGDEGRERGETKFLGGESGRPR
jgi:hypothetical protein